MADQSNSGALVVLVPADSDPITAASSEDFAHMTFVWFGPDATAIGALPDDLQAVVQNYAATITGPVVVPVQKRGLLGDEDADVVYLEPTEALIALRDGLLADPDVRAAHDAVEQYPEWTPHVTLGYPETPANGEYEGEAVTFDRIALWIADEHFDFPFGGGEQPAEGADQPDQAALLASARALVANFDASSTSAIDDQSDLTDAPSIGPQDDEMPVDELEEGEEIITEVPVHGVAAVEGRATGDGRGFRAGALSFGQLPQPLGYEFEHGHGAPNSRVAIVGRIDEYWTVETEEEGVFEARWRGVIFPHKEWGARAIESIIDGSYTGVSVVPDSVVIDVEEAREQLRQRILRDQAENDGEPAELAALKGEAGLDEAGIEMLLDTMIGDGTQETTWFSSVRVRRFDMVPTGAFIEGYTALGHEFVDEMTPDQIEAAATALMDCGCADSQEQADAIVAAAAGFAPGTKDGPGWITNPIPTSRIRRYWVRGEGAAKINWGVPGDFNRCRAQLAKYVQNPDWLAGLCANMHKEALGVWPGQEGGKHGHALRASAERPAPVAILASADALTAAAAPVDAALFANPNLSGNVGVRIEGEHIFGYVALWNVCHIADPGGAGTCTMAPRSSMNYAYFRTGTVQTTEGPMAVGSITMSTGHAGPRLSARAAAAHYDNTGAVIADVACGEDAYGIWFSGRVRPNVSDDDLFALQASGRLSGDWRKIGGSFEMVGALAVNVGGFPIPNADLVASADNGLVAIIAEGIVPLDTESLVAAAAPAPGALTAADVSAIAIQAVDAFVAQQKQARIVEIVAPARAAITAYALAAARQKVAAAAMSVEV